jgi:hypothetical protein
MSVLFFSGFRPRYERRGIFNLEEVLPYICPRGRLHVPGTGIIHLSAHRYLLMAGTPGLACVTCGIQGIYFALERTTKRVAKVAKGKPGGYTFTYHAMSDAEWHFNLYALTEDGHEILMTKDHIVPKSKGGHHAMYNYQLMCQKCNSRKGNTILLPASSLILPEVMSASVV